MKKLNQNQISFSRGGGYAKYYLVVMFALLISLPGWGQPGGEIECIDKVYLPYDIVYDLDTLPCIQDGQSQVLKIKVGPSVLNSSFQIIDSSGQATISGATVSNTGVYTFSITFNGGGWKKLTIVPSAPCHRIKNISVPVLCNCPGETDYKVLGFPDTVISYDSSAFLPMFKYFVIGDIKIKPSTNFSLDNREFIVLGRNEYNDSLPGGPIFGPYITLASTAGGTNPYFKLGLQNGISNKFHGDPCFGMWGGIRFDTTYNQVNFIIENNEVSDAKIAVDNLLNNLAFNHAKSVFISHNTFKGNLNGVFSRADRLTAFNNNQVFTTQMLKPYDIDSINSNHNDVYFNGSGERKKFLTQYGLYLRGQRKDSMTGTTWQGNKYTECVVGTVFDGTFDAVWGSKLNSFSLCYLSGIILDKGELLISEKDTFNILYSDYPSFQRYYQVELERPKWNLPYTYGIFIRSLDSAFGNIQGGYFNALSQKTTGVQFSNKLGAVEWCKFIGTFTPAIRLGYFNSSFSAIKKNYFYQNSEAIGVESNHIQSPDFHLFCNTFKNVDFSIRFSPGAHPSSLRMGDNFTPLGNKFIGPGKLIFNQSPNPSITYYAFENEVYSIPPQTLTNASIFPIPGAIGEDGVHCDSILQIFTPKVSQPYEVEEAKIETLTEMPFVVVDFLGRKVEEEFYYPQDLHKLRPGNYLLRNTKGSLIIRK